MDHLVHQPHWTAGFHQPIEVWSDAIKMLWLRGHGFQLGQARQAPSPEPAHLRPDFPILQGTAIRWQQVLDHVTSLEKWTPQGQLYMRPLLFVVHHSWDQSADSPFLPVVVIPQDVLLALQWWAQFDKQTWGGGVPSDPSSPAPALYWSLDRGVGHTPRDSPNFWHLECASEVSPYQQHEAPDCPSGTQALPASGGQQDSSGDDGQHSSHGSNQEPRSHPLSFPLSAVCSLWVGGPPGHDWSLTTSQAIWSTLPSTSGDQHQVDTSSPSSTQCMVPLGTTSCRPIHHIRTTQLPTYVSPPLDLEAWRVNVLSFPWTNLWICFHPSHWLGKPYSRSAWPACQVILIATAGPSHLWFPQLLSLLDNPHEGCHQPTLFSSNHGLRSSTWILSTSLSMCGSCPVCPRPAGLRCLALLVPLSPHWWWFLLPSWQ